jgi:purine-nucleoside phosphorylase
MVIDSHIDMTFRDSVDAIDRKCGDAYYDTNLYSMAMETMKDMNIPLRTGTYGWTLGPTYETSAEIKLMQSLDIQAVGMSTVPEIERAHELGMKLLGIACLTNYAVGISKTPLTHNEVVNQAKKSSEQFSELILHILNKISKI